MTIQCSVVQDLIPLYAEGLTKKESGEFVEMHCMGCGVCRQELARARASLVPEGTGEDTQEKIWQEIAEKVQRREKKRKRRRIAGIIIVTAAVVLSSLIMTLPLIIGLPYMGDFTSYDEMDYQYIVDNNRLVPEIKDFGTDKLSYRHYHKDDFVFYSDTYSVTAQYTDKQYEDMKKSIEEKYSFFTDTIVYEDGRSTLEPCFEMDGFFFRLLSYEYEQVDIPKNVYIFGFNDKTKQIVFIYFRDDDLDYIESYEEFMNHYCGWNK